MRVATLGSHSALQILKGAKEEGFTTVCVCREGEEKVYRSFGVADEVILIKSFDQLMEARVQQKLRDAVFIPHGSVNAYLNVEEFVREFEPLVFGERELLLWEVDREKQHELFLQAGLRLPRAIRSPEEIKGLSIVKLHGARGGKGYFLATSWEDFERKLESALRRGVLREEDVGRLYIQEYVLGVPVYFSYFNSAMREELELLCVDRRYESFADGLGRIPAADQIETQPAPSYAVVGNFPVVLRESLLAEVLRMGEAVCEAAKRLVGKGLVGPFCLEAAITEDLEIYTFEISTRIVAGTTVGIPNHPYSYIKHGEGMYMGRRIALELKEAIEAGRLEEVTS